MDDMERLKNTLGPTLREARLNAGLTEEELARRLGLVPDIYRRIEAGQMLPSVPTVHRICVTLQLSAGRLLGWEPEAEAPPEPTPPPDASPELLHLALLLRELSPGDLNSLVAIATVLASREETDEFAEE